MIDFTTLKLTRKPNQHLVAPAGLCSNAKPHETSQSFSETPAALLARFRDIALATPRVTLKEEAAEKQAAVFVAKSKIFGFPDVIDVQAIDQGEGQSCLAIYSRAKIGYRDFGVNKNRIDAWMAKL